MLLRSNDNEYRIQRKNKVQNNSERVIVLFGSKQTLQCMQN